MKKFLLIMLAMIVVLASLTACKKDSEDETAEGEPEKIEEKHPNFYLVNLTDKEWVSVVVAVTNKEDGEEILGKRESLYRGRKYPVYLEKISDKDMYDIHCTDTKGETFTYSDLDLYWISKLTLTIDDNLQPLAVIDYRAGYEERPQNEAVGEGQSTEGSSEGQSAEGEGNSSEGYGSEGYNNEGNNSEGYGSEGYNNESNNSGGYGSESYNNEANNSGGYGSEGYNSEGDNNEGYNSEGENGEGSLGETKKSYSFMG